MFPIGAMMPVRGTRGTTVSLLIGMTGVVSISGLSSASAQQCVQSGTTGGGGYSYPDGYTTPITVTASGAAGCDSDNASSNGQDGESTDTIGRGMTNSGIDGGAGPAVSLSTQAGTGGNGKGDPIQASSGGSGGSAGQIEFLVKDSATKLSAFGTAVSIQTIGGTGGKGGIGRSSNGTGGPGGVASSPYVYLDGPIATSTSAIDTNNNLYSAVRIYTVGGAGGYQDGTDALTENSPIGRFAGSGGAVVGVTEVTILDAVTSGSGGVTIDIVGGVGGGGSDTKAVTQSTQGVSGGDGGSGGSATIAISGSIDSLINALTLNSNGGQGGDGAYAGSGGTAIGGDGGAGGAGGGNAQSPVAINLTGSIATDNGDGINVVAGGGTGGQGARAVGGFGASVSGAGGAGGAGGYVVVTSSGTIVVGTDPDDAGYTGISAITRGGAGGDINQDGGFDAEAKTGGAGGIGGTTIVNVTGGTITSSGAAIVADSGGGNGGRGGKATGVSASGGNGGIGGAAGSSTVNLSGVAITTPFTAPGLAPNLYPGVGVYVASSGGTGGAGGTSDLGVAKGGRGGTGGAGSSATVIIGSDVTIAVNAVDDPNAIDVSQPGVWVQSNGGIGGQGGGAGAVIGTAGGGGLGGVGGDAAAQLDGTVSTTGSYAHGVLAQSVGGVGGNGNNAFGLFFSRGGNGQSGADAGSVTITGSGGTVAASGFGASALIAQSVGGGGGSGGRAIAVSNQATIAIGGNGGLGGDGKDVTLGTSDAPLANIMITRGDEATAVFAQSVGGGGGNGGGATSVDVGVLSLAIGGDGKGGGDGGDVTVYNSGVVATAGLQSEGIVAQSVGGGGGNGGAGIVVGAGIINVGVAIGGDGGTGGNGGTVNVANARQITTYGSDSYGIKAQSVSGGGGSGGLASATVIAIAPPVADVPVPAVGVAVSVGGSGGAGGTASAATIDNAGLIATAGAGSIAMLAQSIAGGGGNGGDSSAWSYAGGSDSVSISASIAVGGRAGAAGITGAGIGAGGTGAAVSMNNAALVLTTGESAHGMLGQSIGGGGGQGGLGDATAISGSADKVSLSGAISVGGKGGTASQGGTVQLTNKAGGGILTEGDGAVAMFGQSIGGGGGAAGGGVGSANGDDLGFTVAVGGDGGTGGNGGEVDLWNYNAIRTAGASADGMVAQSVGGGGGLGGKTATSAGTADDPLLAIDSLADRIASAFGVGASTLTITDNLVLVGDGVLSDYTDQQNLQKIEENGKADGGGDDNGGEDNGDGDDGAGGGDAGEGGGEASGSDTNGTATKLNIGVGIGGQGGAGGTGGNVSAINAGSIVTTGAASNGVFVQSVGGGGGSGGASSFSTTVEGELLQLSMNLGGTGSSGDGLAATVLNGVNAQILTLGGGANGIVAQSVGGGGGKVGSTTSLSAGVANISLSLGGSTGTSGAGGTVTVTQDVSALVSTSGKNAIGILAQSVGGGGGIGALFSSDQTSAGPDADAANADAFGLALIFGGSADGTGNGGAVNVVSQVGSSSAPIGGIVTGGRNAYGILAQSIGGGGGLQVGGMLTGNSFFASGSMNGDGGDITVETGAIDNSDPNNPEPVGYNIVTSGQGAVGIFAQSVGGGGGIAGDTGGTAQRQSFVSNGTHSGNGGSVKVTVEAGSTVTTSGLNAPAILAQSIGGGGGRVTTSDAFAFDGTLGGTGTGGAIGITINGMVQAKGAASPGVFAESVGQGANGPISVTINAGGSLSGGTDFNANDGYSAAIYLVGGSYDTGNPNTIVNNGTVNSAAGTLGTSLILVGGYTTLTNNGSWIGQVNPSSSSAPAAAQSLLSLSARPVSASAVGTVTFVNNGLLKTGGRLDLGAGGKLTNSGMLEVGETEITPTNTTVVGDFVQTAAGTLKVDADFAGGKADVLDVRGGAAIEGNVEVHPSTVSNRPVTVVTTTRGINGTTGLTSTRNSQLFSFEPRTVGSTLQIQPRAHFQEVAATLGGNRQVVAAHLQTLFDDGVRFDAGFSALAGVRDAAALTRTLDAISGQALGALAAYRFSSSHDFVANMYDGCASFDEAGARTEESECAWARVIGATMDQDDTDDARGYSAKAMTFQLGLQREVGAHWYVSGSLAYEANQFDGNEHTARIKGDDVLGAAYLRYHNGPLQVSLAADVGYGWYRSRRYLAVGSINETVTARPKAWHVGGHAKVSFELPLGTHSYLKPFVDGHVVYVHAKGFQEAGNLPFALAVDGQANTAFAGAGGAEIGARVPLGGGMALRPFASAAYEVLSNNDWSTRARFVGQGLGPSFDVRTPAPDHLGRFAVGVDLLGSPNMDVSFQYTPEIGQGYVSHAGVARLSYRF